MADHRIEWLDVSALPPAEHNPKQHDLKTLQDSFRRFGFTEPVLLDERTGRIVAGHGRREALLMLKAKGEAPPKGVRADNGEWLVPVLRGLSFENDDEAAAYLLASNRLVEAGGWDRPGLADLLERVKLKTPSLDGIGFDKTAVDTLLASVKGRRATEDAPTVEAAEPQAQLGDVWQLGDHRLVCGDAREPGVWERLLGDERVDLVFTDPPYGVGFGGGAKVEMMGKPRERLAGDATEEEAARLLRDVCEQLLPRVRKGGAVYVCAAPGPAMLPFAHELMNRGILRQVLAWVKDRIVFGRADYHGEWEPMLYGWIPGGKHQRPLDRTLSNVWAFPKPQKSEIHPTQKPVPLVAQALGTSGKSGDVVCDPFGGSGTTLIAAEQCGLKARLVEVSPSYCDAIVARWEQLTGKRAHLANLTEDPTG